MECVAKMLKRFKAFEVPYQYDFKDPDTGFQFKSHNKDDLNRQIVSYRSQNGLDPIEGLALVLENYWCGQIQNAGKCQECPPDMTRGFTEYLAGGMVLLKAMLFKRFVTQEVAEKRAKHCTECRYNIFPDKGPFMAWTDEVAVQCVGAKRKTSYDDKLGQCAVCTCVLKSKVYIDQKLDPFTPKQVERMKQVKCWQLELSGQTDE